MMRVAACRPGYGLCGGAAAAAGWLIIICLREATRMEAGTATCATDGLHDFGAHCHKQRLDQPDMA
jgi:hypothetical protein